MTERILNEMLSDETKKENEKGKIFYLNPRVIEGNKLNSTLSMNDIDEMAMDIMDTQLLQPIVVRKYKGKYYLIAGHRRTAAIRKIFTEGESYRFAGKTCSSEIPAILFDLPESIEPGSVEETEAWLSANAYRDDSKQERIVRVKEAEDCWNRRVVAGTKPKGKKVEYIAGKTGYGITTIKRYLKEEDEFEESSEINSVKLPETAVEKALKLIQKVNPDQISSEDALRLKQLKKDVNKLLKAIE